MEDSALSLVVLKRSNTPLSGMGEDEDDENSKKATRIEIKNCI
uniref:Uncharacterized protein n=1 Tax=Nelumbo nucifera TaxID=4432 RepID=A0A822XHT7_NELNU|nr:TPA_asm: hypothetical protein HUJ06_020082 [Nelumbo nucifera]